MGVESNCSHMLPMPAKGNPTVIQGLFPSHQLKRSGGRFSCLSNQCSLALCNHPCEMNHSLCFDCVKYLEIETFTNITIMTHQFSANIYTFIPISMMTNFGYILRDNTFLINNSCNQAKSLGPNWKIYLDPHDPYFSPKPNLGQFDFRRSEIVEIAACLQRALGEKGSLSNW